MDLEKLVAILFVVLFLGLFSICSVEEYYKTNTIEKLVMHGVPAQAARCAVHKC